HICQHTRRADPLLLPLHASCHLPHLTSFPTRRSSDLRAPRRQNQNRTVSASRAPRSGGWPREARPECSFLPPTRVPSERFVIMRSEEHTSELQSRGHLVCRLLPEKKKTTTTHRDHHTN